MKYTFYVIGETTAVYHMCPWGVTIETIPLVKVREENIVGCVTFWKVLWLVI
jgi:hypothetical protein